MKRALFFIILALFPLLALGQSDPAEHPNVERGFSPEKVYQYGDIDSVNLFNGNVMLMIPIGRSYRVGPSLEYKFLLAYNAKMWDHISENGRPLALPARTANAGLGWQVSFGRVLAPHSSDNDDFRWVYVDPSGLRHRMFDKLHVNDTPYDCDRSGAACDPAGPWQVFYTTDNTYLRLTIKRDNTMTVHTPDGVTMSFGADGRLTRMEDLFGNWVNVFTSFFPNGVPLSETITDSTGRSHVIQYAERTNSQRNYKSQIDTITLEVFETTNTAHTTKATWRLHYEDKDVDRYRIPDSAPASDTVRVPLLTSVDLPAGGGSYEFDYFLHSTPSPGANNQMGCVRKMVYPTRGRLEWDYSRYSNAVDTCGMAQNLEATPGVRERRFYNDATTTTTTAVWTYNRVIEAISDVHAGCGHFPANRLLPEYLSTKVTRPDGGEEKHYFSAWPSLAAGRTNPSPRGHWGEEIGSPFTRWEKEIDEGCDRDELCLSSEIFSDSSASSKKRSTRVRYENDQSDFRPTHPNSLNRRMQAQQTIYHDDGGVFTKTEYSNFDGFGHYRQATSSGNFGSAGDLRTSFTRYNPTFPSWPNMPPVTWNTPWLFSNRDQSCVRDGDASPITDCLGLAGAAITQFHMDANGFMVKKRTLLGSSPDPHDLLLVQEHEGDGFHTRQQFFGGDRQTIDTNSDIEDLYSDGLPSPVYDLRHTYVAGSLATSRYHKANGNPGEFLAINNQIDVNTGLVKKTTDPSGVSTRYTYDGLGRLASVAPDGLASTSYDYDLLSGSGAKVTQTKASTTGSIVTEYEFDGLGRVTRQTGTLEDGTLSSVRMGYDGMNRRTSQTEPAGANDPDGPATTTQYDIFNRPTLITPPDGAAHNVTMQYDGVRTMRRTRSIGTSWNGSTVTETSVTDTETRDALGRLVSLQQPNNVTATYDYDQLDRMTHVRVDGPSGGAQDRTWEYDNRGFLKKELQPESNQTVFEDFDARGHAWGTRTGSATGAFAVNFQFDYAERLVQVKEGAGQRRLLKEFTYDETDDAGHQYSAPGKLVKAIRHNWVSLGGAPAADKPVTRFVQYGASGNISKQSTVVDGRAFTQNFAYNDLGAPSQLRYPTCDDCGVTKGSRDISMTYGFGHLTRVAGLTSASQLIDYWPNGMMKSLTHVGPGGTNPVVDSQTLANGMRRPGSISFTGIDSCATADTTITAPASISASASGSASVPATAGATYSWSVTGGTLASPANGTSITFTAGCSGNVTVTVTTTSSCGAVSSASRQVAITQPAAVVSGGGSIQPGGSATIQVVLTGIAPFRVTWSDGVVQTEQPSGTVTRTVSPSTSTTYTATATNAAGCAAVSSGSAVVTLPGSDLQAAFTVSCSNRTCQVHSTSTGSITRWQWNWGDGTPVIEPGSGDQSHAYVHSGNYTITHTVFNAAGQSSATTRSVVANTPPVAVNDVVSTPRNTPITINLTANDSDPDGDAIVLTPFTVSPANGSIELLDNARIKVTPAASFTGNIQFTYGIRDTLGATASATVTVKVVSSGPPVARNDHAITKRDTPVTINLLANDQDPDGQAIWLTVNPIKTPPRHGTVTVLSQTSVRYTPDPQWAGNDVFEYQIADASGEKDRAWVAVHVGRTRGLPVAVDDTASTTANRAVTIDVLANDSSPDGDPITLTGNPFIRKPLHGRVNRVSDSRVSYTPKADWTGTDTFAYEISDTEYGTAAAFVTVTVTSGNRPPSAGADSAATTSGVAVTIVVTTNDTDLDGDPLELISAPIVVAPQHGTATRASGSSITYTPTAGYAGTDTFQYEISDGHGGTARGTVTITITIPNTNHPPEALDDEAQTTAGVAVTVEVTANDSDVDGDQVSLITNPIITPPANGTAVKVNGSSITYTPRSGYSGTDRFQYEIGDHNSGRSRAWVDVTIGAGSVNRNPVAVDDEFTMLEGTTKDFVVTANDSDPDGDVVSLISSPIIVAPAHGTATKLNTTTIRYTPAAGYVGMDTLQYEIGDGRGKRSRAWMRVMVRDANSRPVAVGDEASTTAGASVTVNVTSNDSDPDGDVVRLITSPIITPPANGTAIKVDADNIKYTPQASFRGTDRFQYEIGDGRGGRHRAWVNVTVSGTSATSGLAAMSTTGIAPLAGNDATEALSDTSVAVVVLANDLSVNGRQVVLTANPIITLPLFGTAQRANDTTLTYTPSTEFRGNDRLEYEVVDADGVTTTAWVTVQIPGDNKPPVAVTDVATAAKDGSVTITPAGNDTDENGDTLVLSVRAVATAPQNGTVRRESDTQLLYTPAPGFTGDDMFVYEITDRRGGSAQAAVTVHVIGGAQTPVAGNDSATVQSGKAIAVNVVANDSDPDGDPVRVVASEAPQHGTLLWSDGTATYQSHSGYVGADSFRYTISDPTGLRAQGTVSVTVAAVNHATIATNDSAETKTRTAVVIGVLANDYDPDPQRLTIASVTQPARGTVAISNDRLSVTYTPASDFAGNDAFQYTVTDGPGSVTASAAVTVTNQAPIPHSEVLSAPEDTWVGYQSYNVLANDVDPDGDELRIVSVEQPAHGQFLIAPDSSQFSYKSKPDWSGMDSFYYTVSDPFGAQVRVFSQIGVSAVNDAPVANDDSFSVYKNQVLNITQAQVVANDTDIEGHQISVYSVGPATNGTTRMLADGTIEYAPYGEFVGTDSFEYTAQDSGGGAYATARITVNVLQDTKPVADFTVTCNGFVCSFDASASTDDRGIVSYQWLLKTGAPTSSPAAGKTFTFTYPNEGVFEARLTVEDVLGQTAVAVKWVTICAPPGIASQPAPQTIFAGYTATLSVTASGTGPFSYQWYEGAAGTTTTPVGTNSSTYTTPGLTATKSYWVRATSTCSGSPISVNSNTVTVTVCQLPGIATHPASKTINSGATATLSVVASGSGPFTYAWYDADTGTFAGGTSSTFTTPALTSTKSYWVKVTSTCNGSVYVNSNVATVTVCTPPAIATHPAPKLINAGATATLTVAATGSGPFSYQWFEGPSGTTTTPVGTNSDTFTTPPLASTKTYWARVTSACNGGTANSNAATVTVCSPPGFATQPPSKTIPTGTSTTLTVVPSGSGPFTYQWYEGAAPSTTTPVGTNSSSFTTPVLTTNKSYWVRVTSWCNGNASANSNTATITMTCAAPPSISASPTSRLIVAGQSTTLSVTASGFGTLSYQWYQGTAPSTATPVGTNSSSLTVTPSVTTNYWVMVSNACGGTASATATVTVCNPPVITSHPASTTINYNATATLSVVATGTGPFSYQWYEGASGVTTTPVGTNSASFTTPPLAATKSYWVRVSNACSTNSNAATVTVNGAVLARRQFAASTANSQLTITTNWTQPTQAGTLLVAIVSAERGWYPIANWQPPAGWQHAVTYEMTHLKTSIYYYPNNPGGRTAETFGNGGYYDDMILQLAEYTGVAATSPLDRTAFNGNTSNDGYVETGYTPQTSQAKELVITGLTSYSMTEFFGPSQSFIELDDRNQGWGRLTTAVHERFTTTAGSWGHYVQVGTTDEWVGVVATFRAAN